MSDYAINCRGRLLRMETPLVMGILNVTPDSFYEGSRVNREDALLRRAEQMLREGAAILDIGGYSSRPGAEHVDAQTELARVVPAIESLHRHFPEAFLSVDTFRASVAKAAVEAGACMINDISGGNLDESMFPTVATLQVPYVLMHMKGTPQTMQLNPEYDDVIMEINRFFARRIEELHALEVNDILVDPGFGFGKTLDDNYRILKHLDTFGRHGKPVLIGISRKSMLYKYLDGRPEDMLNATTAVHMLALQNGASVLRVHDVKEAVEAVRLFVKYTAV
ncbi:MAG: dihydropteroate synthase [Chlorobi bacterium]|nr:dihydropteroate synthase [Chlorobiota bacterium]